jgi:AraC family transcriptional regulator
MANRDCSITEIALAGGFSDSSAFSVAFRRNAGTTPSAYRRSLR